MSDRSGFRGFYVMGFASLGAVGFILCIATANPRVGYAGVCESISSNSKSS